MRISDNMTYDQINANLNRNRSEMADLQNQAATLKRVTKPSDDPVAASRVLSSRVELKGTEQYLKNLDYARSFLEFTDQSLNEVTESLMRLKELAINQSNDASASEESRRVVATEVEQIYNQMVQIGNRKLGERFIFGGFKTQTPPFEINGKYQGDNGEILINVDKDSFLAMNIPGNKVFSGEGTSISGLGGRETQQPLTVDQLKNMQAREVERQNAKPGQENAEARGPASLRVSSEIPSNADGVGDESQLESDKGVNLFSVIDKLKIALKTNDKAGVQDSLDSIDRAMSQVILTRAKLGSRVTVLNSSFESLQKSKVDSSALVSSLEDADMFQVVSDINKTDSTLKATLDTSSRLMQPSLLSFLR